MNFKVQLPIKAIAALVFFFWISIVDLNGGFKPVSKPASAEKKLE